MEFLPLSCVITEIQRRLLLMRFVPIISRGKMNQMQIQHLCPRVPFYSSYFPNSVSLRRNDALRKQASDSPRQANESCTDLKRRKCAAANKGVNMLQVRVSNLLHVWV